MGKEFSKGFRKGWGWCRGRVPRRDKKPPIRGGRGIARGREIDTPGKGEGNT